MNVHKYIVCISFVAIVMLISIQEENTEVMIT
jgi:hypothetical protein